MTNGGVRRSPSWTAAPTEWAQQKMRRLRRLILAIPIGAAVLGGVIGGLVGTAASRRGHQAYHADPTGWHVGVGLGLSAVGLVTVLTGVVLLWRSTGWQPIWRTPMVVLTRRQRRQLSKEVRGRSAAHPRHGRIAQYLARRIVDQRGLVPLLVGAMIMFLGLLLATPSLWRLIYTLVILLTETAAAVSVIRVRRQARNFLEQEPDLTGTAAP